MLGLSVTAAGSLQVHFPLTEINVYPPSGLLWSTHIGSCVSQSNNMLTKALYNPYKNGVQTGGGGARP